MKNSTPLYLYGLTIIVAGILLAISIPSTLLASKLTLGMILILGSVLAFITSLMRPDKKAQLAYHQIHALGMLGYGIAIIFFCNSLETMENFTAFIFFFYAISEITFCAWLLNLKQGVKFHIIFIRLVMSLAVGILTVGLLNYSDIHLQIAIQGYGLIFILIGINVLMFVPILKRTTITE
jgi:hypothetical protein